MENAVAQWLELKFRQVQDVKFATTYMANNITHRNHQPDIRVETWMNSRLYIYVIDNEPKSRTIKGIIKQNTNASIGTQFIINSALLPADGATIKISDWQDDLRIMNHGAIYAYGIVDDELSMIQVNYNEADHRDEYTCWHSKDFPLDAVSVRRREYLTNIKGTWYIGDIASPQFKRRINEERARQRFHYRTKQTKEVNITPADQINAAYIALQIEVGAGQKEVKDAFRKLAREYHPDVSDHDKNEAEERFKEVKEAYDKIKSHRRWK